MWFLLIQILFFMLIAAALGAALAWWWLRRRFIDVTETHAELTRQVEAAISEGRVLTRSDIDQSLANAFAAYTPPQTDLSPIEQRLVLIEERIAASDPKLTVFNGRLANLEQSLADLPSGFNETLLLTSQDHAAALERQSLAFDSQAEAFEYKLRKLEDELHNRLEEKFTALAEKISSLNVKDDLGILQQRFVGVDAQFRQVGELFRQTKDQIAAIRMPDIDSVHSRIAALAQTVHDNRAPDLTPLHTRLTHVEELISNFRVPEVDLGPVHSGLALLDLTLSELQPPDVDLTPIADRLNLLEGQIDALQTSFELRLADNQDEKLVQAISQSFEEKLEEKLDTKLDEKLDDKLLHVDEKLEYLDRRLEQFDMKDVLASVAGDVGMISAEIAHVSGELTSVGEAVSQLDIPPQADMSPVFSRLSEIDISISDRIAQLETRLAATSPLNEALVSTLAGIEADLEVVASRRAPDIDPIYSQLAALDASLSGVRNELRGQVRLEIIEKRLVALQEAFNRAPVSDVNREDIAALEDRLSSIEYGLASLQHMLKARQESIRVEQETLRTRSEVFSAEPVVQDPPPPEKRPQPIRSAHHIQAIASARRIDDEANLLTHAAFGEGDDLARIVGVGPILTELLHEVGVFYFWQIAEWTDEDVAYVDEKLLHFRGRIQRDDWVGQARELAAEPGSARRPGED